MQPTQKPIKKFTPELNNEIKKEYLKKLAIKDIEIVLSGYSSKSCSGVKVQKEKREKLYKHLHFIL